MNGRSAMLAGGEEFKVVALLSLGFGLVGIDRFLITTLYPVIARDLHLSYGDIGAITGTLAIAWSVSAFLMGNLADRIGHRLVLSASLVAFSLLIGASGLATGLFGLIAVRVVMGFADGAYTPVSIAATMAASSVQRRGLNIGIQQMMMPLFGLGLAPLLIASLLRIIDWRYIFLIFVLPGLALSWASWQALPRRNVIASHSSAPAAAGSGPAAWKQVLGFRNVRIAALLMLCWLTCLITTSAFLPSYLIDYLHVPLPKMGAIMSAIGLGAMVGTLLLPWASDKVGRKLIMALSSAGALVSLLLLRSAHQSVAWLFTCLFMVHFFNNALITLTVGPLCSEAVPPARMATASGLVIAVGEMFGGGVAPFLVGLVAQRFGIEQILWLPVAMMASGFLLCLAIREASRSGLKGSYT